MTKRAKVYQILTFVFGISLIILLLFMGITAVQKSMKLNIGFEVKPTFLCEIKLNGEQIFSNHDENAAIANGADLTGNTLTLNQTFYADLGAELTFTVYNYSEFKTKVSVKNTDKFAILPAYANGTASFGTITLDTPSGNVELVFEEYVTYTLTFNANTGNGSMSSMETGSGEILVLPTNTFTKDGYAFVGWNTKADGSGTTYTNLANISLTANTTLYAQWVVAVEYTITYAGDENTFDSSNPTTITKGSPLQLHFKNYISSSPYIHDNYFQLPLTKAAGASDDYVIIKVGNIVLIENMSFTPTIINGGELNIFIASEHITGDIHITIYTNCEM